MSYVDNHIRRFKRPEGVAHRDFRPIEPLADDCLADLAGLAGLSGLARQAAA